MTHANKNVQQAVGCVGLETRREDRTKDQDLRILRAEKVIKDMVLDFNTQREGGEWGEKNEDGTLGNFNIQGVDK